MVEMTYEVIGQLNGLADTPPKGTYEQRLAWRTGYQNALSDLIDILWPESPGGKRLSMSDIQREDDRRRNAQARR